jgi:dihydrofolate reductase
MGDRTWTGKVFIGTSVDGFIARDSGDIDWLTARGEEAGDTGYDAFMAGVDHIVMGRGTYEKVLGFGFWPYEGKRVLVLSTTLQAGDARVRVVPSVGAACEVLDRDARGVYVDGGQVIQAFLREGLVDELTITQVPVLIGTGKPLFGALPRDLDLELVGQHAPGAGLVQVTWRVRHAARGTVAA